MAHMQDTVPTDSSTHTIDTLLTLFTQSSSRTDYLDAVVELIQLWSGCQCVGARVLDKEGNIPYESYRGFSQEFGKSESWLSIKRDQCVCSRVIAGRAQPQDAPCMTSGGSFWSNNTSEFVAALTAKEQQSFRGACFRSGFASVAIVPFRWHEKILGAFHLADTRQDVIQGDLVEFLELVGPIVGEAVYRFGVGLSLRHSQETEAAVNALLHLALEDIPLEEILERTLDLLLSISWLAAQSRAAIFLVEDEPGVLLMKTQRGLPAQLQQTCHRLPFGRCLCGQAALTGDVQHGDHPLEAQHDEIPPHEHYCIPILSAGDVLGVINVYLSSGHLRRWDRRSEEEFLTAIADTLAGVIMRKRAEEALRQSEEKYRNLFQYANDSIFVIDPPTRRFLDVNDTAAKHLGYTREELLTMTIDDLNFPASAADNEEALRELWRTGTVMVERHHRRKDGTEMPVQISCRLLEYGGKQVIESFARDITEQKRAEERLRESERKYRELADMLPQPIFETDEQGRVTFANEAAFDYFGYAQADVDARLNICLGTTLADRARAEEDIGRVLQGQPIQGQEYEAVTKDGRPFPVIVYASPIVCQDKVAGIRGVVVDITEHKRAQERLRESEEHLRSVVQTASDAIVSIDSRGNVTFWNSAAESVFGYSADETVGKPVVLLMPERFRQNHQIGLDRVVSTRKSQILGKTIEVTGLRKDGSEFPVELSLATWSTGAGAFFTGIARDVTERNQTLEALRASEERYRRLVELSPDGIAVHAEGRIIFANTAAAKLLGATNPTQLIGKPLMDFVHPDYRQIVQRRIQVQEEGKEVPLLEEKLLRLDGMPIDVEVAAMSVAFQGMTAMQIIARDITARKRAEEEVKQSFARLEETLEGTIQSMALMVEMRDPYTAGHQQKVARLSSAIAREMRLSDEQTRVIYLAAAIHDVGKINVPAEILSKPGQLGQIEFALVKSHSESGYDILKRIEFPWPIADIVRQHHERMDGSGYPLGLSGPDILLEARILGVADVVEAMASHRPYRAALGIDAAFQEIERKRGVLYDPEVVDACLRLFTTKAFTWEIDLRNQPQATGAQEPAHYLALRRPV